MHRRSVSDGNPLRFVNPRRGSMRSMPPRSSCPCIKRGPCHLPVVPPKVIDGSRWFWDFCREPTTLRARLMTGPFHADGLTVTVNLKRRKASDQVLAETCFCQSHEWSCSKRT